MVVLRHAPRFMTNEQLRQHFGLSERALRRVKAVRDFPQKNALTNRTDSRAVHRFFDRMSGLTSSAEGGTFAVDGEERF